MKLITTAGKRLKDIREIRELTLAELSKLCNVPAQTLNRYELEQRIPKLDNIIKISEALNINPLWLQGYDVPLENEIIEEKPATTNDDRFLNDLQNMLQDPLAKEAYSYLNKIASNPQLLKLAADHLRLLEEMQGKKDID